MYAEGTSNTGCLENDWNNFLFAVFLLEPSALNIVSHSSKTLLTNADSRAMRSFFSAETITMARAFLSIYTALLLIFVLLMGVVARLNLLFFVVLAFKDIL